jgi:hypothetical protein
MGSASITIDPSPPDRGATVTFKCEGIAPGTTLKLDWNPPGKPTELVVGEDGKASCQVPNDAEDLIVTEPESGAEAATTVNP